MTTHVLGISAFYHDAAAAVVTDGEIVAAAQEERFTRKKHDPRFPKHAINYCLQEAFIEADELRAVVFYDNPVLSADRIVKSLVATAPESREQWVSAARSFLGVKPFVERYVRDMLKVDVPVWFARHHLSHAASAFYPSPFAQAAILTLDGVGEWATTSLAEGRGDDLRVLAEIRYPHSLGLLYSAFTAFCGFKVNSGEYKLMGLAPYGKPRYAEVIRDKLIAVRPDGSFRLDTSYFGYLTGDRMTNARFEELFGGPPREPESRITRREMDLAASIQAVTEDVVLAIARHLRAVTDLPDLCLAGGVALNCVANGKLLREKVFDRIWIQPAAGDAGGSVGAALLASHRMLGVARVPAADGRDRQRASYLGPAFSTSEIAGFLDSNAYPHVVVSDLAERSRLIARHLAEGKVVGHFSGRMEFGPRALGARSILGDARSPETQAVMNLKIKYRESFRPFAPSVLAEKCSDYFELPCESPYMLLVAPVQESRRLPTPALDTDDMLPVVRQVRSDVPAITHVDHSARIQTVRAEDHPAYHALITAFEELTGCAVIVNTSFNVRGEPIVCTPKDAYTCFMRTEMDVLVLEDRILYKDAQPARPADDSWRREFELD
jgi:carbamoyltransferase